MLIKCQERGSAVRMYWLWITYSLASWYRENWSPDKNEETQIWDFQALGNQIRKFWSLIPNVIHPICFDFIYKNLSPPWWKYSGIPTRDNDCFNHTAVNNRSFKCFSPHEQILYSHSDDRHTSKQQYQQLIWTVQLKHAEEGSERHNWTLSRPLSRLRNFQFYSFASSWCIKIRKYLSSLWSKKESCLEATYIGWVHFCRKFASNILASNSRSSNISTSFVGCCHQNFMHSPLILSASACFSGKR